jgi:ABC-2 type transport system permease protein
VRTEPAGGGAAAAARSAGGSRRGTLVAFVELRLRLALRRFRGRGGIPELVARIAMFATAVPAGVVFAALAGTASFQAVRAGVGFRAELPAMGLFYGVWQTWTAVSLSLADREALDLRRFLGYPLPPRQLWAYGLAASVLGDPFALFWCLLLAGGFGGAALGRPGAWLLLFALVLLLFVVTTAALVALLQELLARLLRGRRAREVAIATVYVATAVLVAWSLGVGKQAALHGLGAARLLRFLPFPAALASEATRILYAGRYAAAVPWIVALALAALVTGWAAYRLAIADALAGGASLPAAGARGGQGWRIPGRLGPLLEKEGKYLLRHPLASVLLLVVPAFAALVGWRAAPAIPAEAGEVIRALPLLGLALYAHLSTQVFWLNAFGWDRGGARVLFLAPISPGDAILAKNAATYLLSLTLFVASSAALIATGGRPPGWALCAGIALHAGIAPVFLVAGNAVSILNPRAASHTVQRGGRLSPVSGLAGMAIVSGGAGLFAAPVLVALRMDEPWVLVGAWAALGLAGLVVYRALHPRLARLLAARREELLAAVAGDED